jgi:hypothetical protein
MRLRTMCLSTVIMAFAVGLAFAQTKKALTNDDVIQMVKAGFEDETIIKAIQASDLQLDASAAGLITLKNAGVSKKIIDAMLEAEAKKRATAAPEAAAPKAAAEEKE